MLASIAANRSSRHTVQAVFEAFTTDTGYMKRGIVARTFVPGFCRLSEIEIETLDKLENGSYLAWATNKKPYELKPDAKIFIDKV
jgi:hypothetical protein